MSPFRSSGAPHGGRSSSLPTQRPHLAPPPLRPPAVPVQTRTAPLPSLPAEHLAGKVKKNPLIIAPG